MRDKSTPLATECISGRAIRLLFSFEGDKVSLVSQQFVEMTLPPSDSVVGTQAQRGFWYELRDDQDQPLYRRVMNQPIGEDMEVFSDDLNQRNITRQPALSRKGVFAVLVPDVEEGQTVTLSSSSRRFPQEPAKVIGRFALRK